MSSLILARIAERNTLPLLRALARGFNNPRRGGPERSPRSFYSVRRRVPANHATTHANENTVAEAGFTGSKIVLRAAQMLSEARAWAAELTALEVRGPNDLEHAWSRLERRHGIPRSAFWSLRYRFDTLKSIDGPVYSLLRDAHIAEAERQLRRFQQTVAINALKQGKSAD